MPAATRSPLGDWNGNGCTAERELPSMKGAPVGAKDDGVAVPGRGAAAEADADARASDSSGSEASEASDAGGRLLSVREKIMRLMSDKAALRKSLRAAEVRTAARRSLLPWRLSATPRAQRAARRACPKRGNSFSHLLHVSLSAGGRSQLRTQGVAGPARWAPPRAPGEGGGFFPPHKHAMPVDT